LQLLSVSICPSSISQLIPPLVAGCNIVNFFVLEPILKLTFPSQVALQSVQLLQFPIQLLQVCKLGQYVFIGNVVISFILTLFIQGPVQSLLLTTQSRQV
jgi:hypothetical protein